MVRRNPGPGTGRSSRMATARQRWSADPDLPQDGPLMRSDLAWLLLALGTSVYPAAAQTPPADRPAPNAPAEGARTAPEALRLPPALEPAPAPPATAGPAVSAASAGAQPLTLQAALYGAVTSNPDLVALRQGTAASAESVAVARRFPVTLNPTLWIDVRPLAYERNPGR